ncbi:MAG: hypothetical protein QME40_07135 [bacterium]|nr:hypothetical protein [bacterium]
MKETVSIESQGVKLRFDSNCSKVIEYVKNHFGELIKQELDDYDIIMSFEWINKTSSKGNLNRFDDIIDLDKISRRILIGSDQIIRRTVPEFPGLQMRSIIP